MRTFKVTVGGPTGEVILSDIEPMMTDAYTTLSFLGSIRCSLIVFYVSTDDAAQIKDMEVMMVNNHGDITVTEVTGTGWKI